MPVITEFAEKLSEMDNEAQHLLHLNNAINMFLMLSLKSCILPQGALTGHPLSALIQRAILCRGSCVHGREWDGFNVLAMIPLLSALDTTTLSLQVELLLGQSYDKIGDKKY